MYVIEIDPVGIFQAFSERTRLRVIKLFLALNGEELCLCELTDALQEAEYNISRHLKVLRRAGLLTSRKHGRWVYHSLTGNTGLLTLFAFIKSLPDPDGIYREDLKRIRIEIRKRKGVRCTKDAPEISKRFAAGARKRA